MLCASVTAELYTTAPLNLRPLPESFSLILLFPPWPGEILKQSKEEGKVFDFFFQFSWLEKSFCDLTLRNEEETEMKLTWLFWSQPQKDEKTRKNGGSFFKGCPGRGANLESFGFCLFSLSIPALWPLGYCAPQNGQCKMPKVFLPELDISFSKKFWCKAVFL